MSGMGCFVSGRVPLGPLVATLWSVMVPSCLSSVLSSRKLALAGLGWSTCVRVGPFQFSPERGPSGPELVLSGLTYVLLASREITVGMHTGLVGTLSFKSSSVYVIVRSVEHECIAFIARSRLIPIMTRLRKNPDYPPPPPPYMLTPPLLSKPSPTTQGEL